MPSENKTPVFGLSKYSANDKPQFLTDHNADVDAIDANALHKSVYDPTGVNADAFRASNTKMTGYSKYADYSPVQPSDTAMGAIAKLEAGVGASGDMKKSVYDTNGDGKVDTAKIADEAIKVPWTGVENRPSALPTPNALKIQLNGTDAATFNGSAVATVNVTPASISAAAVTDVYKKTEVYNKSETDTKVQSALDKVSDGSALPGNIAYSESGLWTPAIASGAFAINSITEDSNRYYRNGSHVQLYARLKISCTNPSSGEFLALKYAPFPFNATSGLAARSQAIILATSDLGTPFCQITTAGLISFVFVNSQSETLVSGLNFKDVSQEIRLTLSYNTL